MRDKIYKRIKHKIEEKNKYVIYPYGYIGKIVETILIENHIEYIIVDANIRNSNDKIYGLDVLRIDEFSDWKVLFCSNNVYLLKELWEQILSYVPYNRIYDVCEKEWFFSKLESNDPRIATLECVAREIRQRKIKGNVAEAGVYKGWFAKCINRMFADRKLYLIDTFEGFDERDTIVEVKKEFSKADQNWGDTSVEFVLSQMEYVDRCIVKKGFFPDVMQDVIDEFCFVSLDMDLYQPIYAGLEYFYPRLSKGGYIFVHDCRNEEYLGARKAVLDFCEKEAIGYVPLSDEWGTVVITKA